MATKGFLQDGNEQQIADHPCKQDPNIHLSLQECFAQSMTPRLKTSNQVRSKSRAACSTSCSSELGKSTHQNLETEASDEASPKERMRIESTTTSECVTRQVQDVDAVSPSPALVEDDAAAGSSTTSSSSSEEAFETSSLDQEVRRLQVLKSYLGVLDGENANSFERLSSLTSRIFRTPMALVTIADLDKQYVVAGRGWNLSKTVKSPFCSHAVSSDCDFFFVGDAAADGRFQNDPQVTGAPRIRFYAGVPLVCPEGYKLGTLCVMDTQPRVEVSLDEKQGLMEVATMVMENLVDLRMKVNSALDDPSQLIACTAHDLLTPLTGIALSLSLLKDDEALQRKLTEQQKDMIDTAANCSTVMNSICQRTMEGFRDQGRTKSSLASTQPKPIVGTKKNGPSSVRVSDLVRNLNMVMEPFPKQVPLVIKVDSGVPTEFVSDDMKIFRSATNFLTNACAKTESGSIQLKIYTRKDPDQPEEIVFECHDTGPGVDVAKYAYLFKPVREESDPLRVSRSRSILHDVPAGACRAAVQNTGLGLYSVATQISSLGGKYGFRPRDREQEKGGGSVFWFCIPLVLPRASTSRQKLTTNRAQRNENSMLECEIAAFRKPHSRAIEQKLELGKIEDDAGMRSRLLVSSTSSRGLPMYNGATKIAKPSEDTIMVDPLKQEKRLNISPTNRKIQALIIEDSLVVRKSIARALTKLGFEVTQATNGMEGLKELQRSLYDVVLCDFLMPIMDGLDCIQQYRQWEKVNRPYFSQYIVGISAHASDKDVEQGFRIGMNEFRPKPVTYKQLMDLKNGKEFSRISTELDCLGHEVESVKRRKLSSSAVNEGPDLDERVCLVVELSTVISKIAERATENGGWKIVSVNDGESALRLLRMRNWDAVLLDDDLSRSRFMTTFRDWEKAHRVNRQNNVVLVSSSFVCPHDETPSSFQVPTGFDAGLGKPLRLQSLQAFLSKAAEKSSCFACDIVTR